MGKNFVDMLRTVGMLGEQDRLETLAYRYSSGQISENEAFFSAKFASRFVNQADYVRDLLHQWYGVRSQELIDDTANKLREDSLAALLHPGIANRHLNFVNFSLGNTFIKGFEMDGRVFHDIKRPLDEMIEIYGSSLGTRTVFRGMMLSAEEAHNVRENGIRARALLDPKLLAIKLRDYFTVAKPTLDPDFYTGPLEDINYRQVGPTDLNERMHAFGESAELRSGSLMISVSNYKQVAESTGYYGSGRVGKNGYSLFVFEIEIPELELIERRNLFDFPQGYHQGNYLFYKGLTPLSAKDNSTAAIVVPGSEAKDPVADSLVYFSGDSGFELFVPFHIPARLIKNVHEYDSSFCPRRFTSWPFDVSHLPKE